MAVLLIVQAVSKVLNEILASLEPDNLQFLQVWQLKKEKKNTSASSAVALSCVCAERSLNAIKCFLICSGAHVKQLYFIKGEGRRRDIPAGFFN